MIISIALILAISLWNVNPIFLLLLMVTWIPDIIIFSMFADLINNFVLLKKKEARA